MARINVLKRIKTDDKWRMVSIPRHKNGRYNWKALPSGRYYIEWWEAGKRKRQAAGITTAQALEVARRKKHNLEGRALGLPHYQQEEPTGKTPLHVAVRRYLEAAEAFRKPNTIRKYQTVLKRFLEFFAHKKSARDITTEDLNDFMVHLKKKHRLGNNTVIHHMIICAQYPEKTGNAGDDQPAGPAHQNPELARRIHRPATPTILQNLPALGTCPFPDFSFDRIP